MTNINILIGHRIDELSDVDTYFNEYYELSWFESELAINMLKDICGYKEHIGHAITIRSLFDDDEFVTIAMRELPSGVKALLILLNTNEEYLSLTRCGNNCAKWVIAISK